MHTSRTPLPLKETKLPPPEKTHAVWCNTSTGATRVSHGTRFHPHQVYHLGWCLAQAESQQSSKGCGAAPVPLGAGGGAAVAMQTPPWVRSPLWAMTGWGDSGRKEQNWRHPNQMPRGPHLTPLEGHSGIRRSLHPAQPHRHPSKGGEGAELLLGHLLPLRGRTRLGGLLGTWNWHFGHLPNSGPPSPKGCCALKGWGAACC